MLAAAQDGPGEILWACTFCRAGFAGRGTASARPSEPACSPSLSTRDLVSGRALDYPDAELAQLRRIDRRRRVRQGARRTLRLREGDHLPDRGGTGQTHHEPGETEA